MDLKISDAFWIEFKHRHDLFWSLLRSSLLAHTFFLTIAFLPGMPDSTLAKIFFPICALILAFLSSRILQAEVSRMIGPARLHREFLLKHMSKEQKISYTVMDWHENWEKLLIAAQKNRSLLDTQSQKDYLPKDPFLIERSDFTNLMPKPLNYLFPKRGVNTRTISEVSVAKLIPIAWTIYGVSTALLLVSIHLWPIVSGVFSEFIS